MALIEDRKAQGAATLSRETRDELYQKLERLAKGLRRVLVQLSLRGEGEQAIRFASAILGAHARKEN